MYRTLSAARAGFLLPRIRQPWHHGTSTHGSAAFDTTERITVFYISNDMEGTWCRMAIEYPSAT